MLDVGTESGLARVSWEAIPLRAKTPEHLDRFFAQTGPTPPCVFENRARHRFYLRARAVIEFNGDVYAGFSRDVSRSGMGIVSPVQLFPKDVVTILLPEREPVELRIIRCLRMDDRCFACGAAFVANEAADAVE